MTNPRQFWMVQGIGTATFRHDTYESAQGEADRLARMKPGEPFYVMEAVSCHRKVEIERIDLRRDGDNIPF